MSVVRARKRGPGVVATNDAGFPRPWQRRLQPVPDNERGDTRYRIRVSPGVPQNRRAPPRAALCAPPRQAGESVPHTILARKLESTNGIQLGGMVCSWSADL